MIASIGTTTIGKVARFAHQEASTLRKQQYNSYARTAHTTAIHAQRTTHSTQHTAHSTQHTVTELRKIKLSRVYMDSESIELG